jgi:hypothetical protein
MKYPRSGYPAGKNYQSKGHLMMGEQKCQSEGFPGISNCSAPLVRGFIKKDGGAEGAREEISFHLPS